MPSSHDRLTQLQTIIDVQARVTDTALDLDVFMQEVVETVGRLTEAKGALVELVDGDDMVYRCTSATLAHFLAMRIKREGSLSGLCVAQKQVLRCDDSEHDTRVNKEACRKVGVRSMVCTPLFRLGEPVGVIKVLSGEPHYFDEIDVQTLELMAGALGSALGQQLEFDAKNRIEAALRNSETRLQSSEARMRALLQHAHDAVISMNEQGFVTEWNGAAERLFGWSAPEAMGREVAELIVPAEMRAAHRAGLARFLQSETSTLMNRRMEMPAINRHGEPLQIELSLSAVRTGTHWEFLSFAHDIAERKRMEQQLHQMAREDSLTGLANRRAFMEAAERVLARAQRHGHTFAMLYMDMNGFKQINDVHGHEIGDLALQEFAQRLLKVVRRTDTVSRLGGDEFAILAEGITTLDAAHALAHKIQESLTLPMNEPPLILRTSIGISIYHGQPDASTLLREADTEMYEHKKRLAESRKQLQPA